MHILKILIIGLLGCISLKCFSQERPKFQELYYILNNLNVGDADIYFAKKSYTFVSSEKATESLESKAHIGTQFKYQYKVNDNLNFSISFIEDKNRIFRVLYLVNNPNELVELLEQAKRMRFVYSGSTTGRDESLVTRYKHSNNELSIVKYILLDKMTYLLVLERHL